MPWCCLCRWEGETFYVKIDGQYVYTRAHTWCANDKVLVEPCLAKQSPTDLRFGINVCGDVRSCGNPNTALLMTSCLPGCDSARFLHRWLSRPTIQTLYQHWCLFRCRIGVIKCRYVLCERVTPSMTRRCGVHGSKCWCLIFSANVVALIDVNLRTAGCCWSEIG